MALFPKVWRLSFGLGMNHICAEEQTFVNVERPQFACPITCAAASPR